MGKKDWAWKDMPVGTIYEFKEDRHKWKKISDTHELNLQEDKTDEVSGTFVYQSSKWKIILPHGYQSPLWKVLNGESIEGEE